MKRILVTAMIAVLATSAWAQGTPPPVNKAAEAPKKGLAPPKSSKTQPPPEKTDIGKLEKKKAQAAADKKKQCLASCETEAKEKFPLPRPGTPNYGFLAQQAAAQQKAYVRKCQKVC